MSSSSSTIGSRRNQKQQQQQQQCYYSYDNVMKFAFVLIVVIAVIMEGSNNNMTTAATSTTTMLATTTTPLSAPRLFSSIQQQHQQQQQQISLRHLFLRDLEVQTEVDGYNNNNDDTNNDNHDFDSLNEYWFESSLRITLNDTMIQQNVVRVPLLIQMTNITCTTLQMKNMNWTYHTTTTTNQQQEQQEQEQPTTNDNTTTATNLLLDSVFHISGIGMDCTLDYLWEYGYLGSTGKVSLSINEEESQIRTNFGYQVTTTINQQEHNDDTTTTNNINEVNSNEITPSWTSTTNPSPKGFNVYTDCDSYFPMDNIEFFGENQPINMILNSIENSISQTITNLMEQRLCTLIENILVVQNDTTGTTTDDNNVDTNTTTTSTTSTTDIDSNHNNKNPFLFVEETMYNNNTDHTNVTFLNFLSNNNNNTNDSTTTTSSSSSSFNPIIKLIQTIMKIRNTFFDVTRDNDENTTNQYSSLNLRSNEFLNGPNGFFTNLTKPIILLLPTEDDNSNTVSTTSSSSSLFSSIVTDHDSTNTTTPSLITNLFGITRIMITNVTMGNNNTNMDILSLFSASSSFIRLIGNYTFDIQLMIPGTIPISITFEIERIHISSNSNNSNDVDDAVSDANNTTISTTTENITLSFHIHDFGLRTGLVLLLDENQFNTITLGNLLSSTSISNLLSCLSNKILYQPESIPLSGMIFNPILSIDTIQFNGLQSNGINRLVTTGMEYILDAYSQSFGTILSNYLPKYMTIDLQSLFRRTNSNNSTNTGSIDDDDDNGDDTTEVEQVADTCPVPVNGLTMNHDNNNNNNNNEIIFVDVRDLLLPPNEAIQYGGTGLEPYGNFTWSLLQQLIDRIHNNTTTNKYQNGTDDTKTTEESSSSLLSNFTIPGEVFVFDRTIQFNTDKNNDNHNNNNNNNNNEPNDKMSRTRSLTTKAAAAAVDHSVQVHFALSNVRFENQGSNSSGTESLQILQPVLDEPYLINNTIAWGRTTIGGTILLNIQQPDENTSNSRLSIGSSRYMFDTSITLESLNVIITLLVKAVETKFISFPLGDMLNVHCWLALFPPPELNEDYIRIESENTTGATTTTTSLGLTNLAIIMDGIGLNITCYDCPLAAARVAEHVSTGDHTNKITQLIQRFIDLLVPTPTSNQSTTVTQRELDRALYEAPLRCPHYPTYNASFNSPDLLTRLIDSITAPDSFTVATNTSGNKSTINFIIGVIVALITIVFTIYIVHFIIRRVVTKRFHNLVRTLPVADVQALMVAQTIQETQCNELNSYSGALIANPSVPKYVRFVGIPLLLCTASFFFWMGLFCPSMAVALRLDILGETVYSTTTSGITFSLATFTRDWWKDGARMLAVLSVLSIVWPQTRIITTLVLWCVPPSGRFGVRQRESLIRWMDVFGKWSVTVVFIVIVSTSVFKGEVESELYNFQFRYIPLWGIYAIIIGQVLTEVSSKWILHYHTEIIKGFELYCDEKKREANLEERSSMLDDVSEDRLGQLGYDIYSVCPEDNLAICDSTFIRPHRGGASKLKIRKTVQYSFIALCVLIMMIVPLACAVPSFKFDISGILAAALNFGQTIDKSIGSSTIFSTTSTLMESAEAVGKSKYYVGLGFICIFLIVTVLVTPVIEALILMVIWTYPMQLQHLQKLQFAVSYLEAWQYTEVYFVAVVASSIQLHGISQFFTESYCQALTDLFRALVYWGFLDENDGQCIAIQSRIQFSTLIFLFVPIALLILRTFAKDAIDHKTKEDNNRLIISKSSSTELGTTETNVSLSFDIDGLRPTPVHFTDRFRWALQADK